MGSPAKGEFQQVKCGKEEMKYEGKSTNQQNVNFSNCETRLNTTIQSHDVGNPKEFYEKLRNIKEEFQGTLKNPISRSQTTFTDFKPFLSHPPKFC